MWLIVKLLKLVFRSLAHLLLSDLVLQEFAVGTVLILAVLALEVLHSVHIVHCRVELVLLEFASFLDFIDLSVETVESLLVDFANRGE